MRCHAASIKGNVSLRQEALRARPEELDAAAPGVVSPLGMGGRHPLQLRLSPGRGVVQPQGGEPPNADRDIALIELWLRCWWVLMPTLGMKPFLSRPGSPLAHVGKLGSRRGR